MHSDFLSSLLDEVALEGLDGITLSMLWVRLRNRRNFSIALDDESKVFFWECIAVHRNIELYELPAPRAFTPIYNRYEHIDVELGIALESSEKIVDLHPISFVKDEDVRGSCSTYNSRICITSEIRRDNALLMSLIQVNEKWGEKLVLVASPKARLLALIGTQTDPLLEMSQEEYCLLERIGRSRYLGEVTQGEGGLSSLKAPFCKHLHHHRKKLTRKGLVTKQMHYMKNKKGISTSGSLFHLTRFHVPRKTRLEHLMKCMCDILREKPHNREQSKILKEALDIKENTFKKLLHSPFQKCVKMVTIPYKEFFPDATPKEKLSSSGQEKMIKVVQLLKHFDDLESIELEEDSGEKEEPLPLDVHFDYSTLCYDLPLLSQVYKIIKDAGPEGITSASIREVFNLPSFYIRALLKTLIKENLLVSVLHERGRQKENKYIVKSYILESEEYIEVKAVEHELSQEKRTSNKLQKNLKRKIANSPDASKPASKRVKFNDEDMVQEEKENKNTPEESFKLANIQKVICEVSEIQDSDVFTGKAPKLIGLTETVNTSIRSSSCQLTDRKLKRMKMVLDNLKSVRLSTVSELQKYLINKEKEEGYSFKLDKKSTTRILHKLFVEKKLRIYKAVLKSDKQKVELEFICDSSVESGDSRIRLAVEQAKFTFFSHNTKALEKNKKSQANTRGSTVCDEKYKTSDENSVSESRELEKISLNSSFAEKRISEYQANPKCVRCKTLHEFLFYLVYDYEGHSGDQSKTPTVYHDSMTWKRFVPPLRTVGKEGWCFLIDVYNCMPLSVFAKVFNLRYRTKHVAEYLGDDEKCHYLIIDLPQELRSNLLNRRHYLFAFDDVLKYLCYMGLITFGPRAGKLKQEVYLYIHKKVAFKDTTVSTPGYIHINSELSYEKKIFPLNTIYDVESFWIDLERVCLHTLLGKYSSVAGKTIAIVEANHKPLLIEVSKNKSFDEIIDVVHIPGDGLGAGGFDSSLFLHARRKWQSSNSVKNEKNVKTDSKKCIISMQNLLKHKEILGPKDRSRLQRLRRYRLRSQKDKVLEGSTDSRKFSSPAVMPKKKHKIKLRTVKMRNKKIRQPYIDEKDKAAMQKMSKSRCAWSAQEDSFLLLCKVASSFLDPTSRALVVPYTVVRDLLHEKFPHLSANKSSSACKRRVRYVMMNSTTVNNITVFLGEAKQDENLVREFGRLKPVKTSKAVSLELFTGVLKGLLEKFTRPAADRCKNISLPSSMEIFNRAFEIISPCSVYLRKSNHQNPDSEDEVIYSTLYSLIVSAMAIRQDGTEWSYLLKKLYQVHPEYVLKLVVRRLQSEKVVTLKKRTSKKDLSSLMSTFPYRFSTAYDNAMLTKFPVRLFNESKELIDILKCKNSKDGVELKGDVAVGYAAAILALVSLGNLQLTIQIPDQIIFFDSLSTKARANIVERMKNTLSDKESIKFSKLLKYEKVSSQESGQKNVEFENMDEHIVGQTQDKSKKKAECEELRANEIRHPTNASRFALYILRQELSQPPIERVQHSHDHIVLNSCKVSCHLKSRIDTPTSSNDIAQNQNIPHLRKNLREPKAKILTDDCIFKIKESRTAFIPAEVFSQTNFDESLEKIYGTYSPETLSDAKSIFGEIFKSGIIGVTEKHIWEKFRILNGELSFFEHLHMFRETMLVVRAGVASFVYVCVRYAKSWVLTSYTLPKISSKTKLKVNEAKTLDSNTSKNTDDYEMVDSTENRESSHATDNSEIVLNKEVINFSKDHAVGFTQEVHFLPRTWRHPDGTLNKSTFIELLQTVLSYVISSPGVRTSCVTDHFSLPLRPVQTLELLEILEKACCITKYYTRRHPNRTLFSRPANIFVTKNPDPCDLDHLEPLPDAICNLARIQEAIMQM